MTRLPGRIDAGELSLVLRDPVPSDDGYVLKTLIMSSRSSDAYRAIPGPLYYDTVGEAVRRSWATAPVRAVACPPEDPDLIAAALMGVPGDVPMILGLMVRPAFRGMGLAAAMAGLLLGVRRDSPVAYAFPTRALGNMAPRWPLLRHVPLGGR